jgi:hypothetical protein
LPYLEQLQYHLPFAGELLRLPSFMLSCLLSVRTLSNRSALVPFALVSAIAVAASGCSEKADTTPCVATGAVTLARDRAAIGSPLKVTYRFDVAQNASIPQDYTVFVHVLDDQQEMLWGDDHRPPEPTSTWKPGQRVEYTRTIFVPNYPYIGPAHVRIGLYQPSGGTRLPLCGTEISQREYEVARFQLLPQSENIFLIYKEGWHPAEMSSDNPGIEWQWTKKAATISFRNPKKDATFYLEYDARVDKFSPPQQVRVMAGDQMIGTFAADSKERKLVTFPITAAQLGAADMSEITLDVGQTFVPGDGDARELGIRVFHAFVEPR